MARYTITAGVDGKDFIFARGENVGVITRGKHGTVYTCTIEGERTQAANGECVPGARPAWAVKRARQAGLIGARRAASAPRKRKPSDRLRDQDQPEVLGYELDRDSLTPARTVINTSTPGDYGRDPLPQPDGSFLYRMVPSGDVVTYDESERRLRKKSLSGLGATKPSPAARKAIEAKMKKLQARRDKLAEARRKAMWADDVTLDAYAELKAKFDAEDDALDDALTVLDWQRLGKKPPRDVVARTRPELLRGTRRRRGFAGLSLWRKIEARSPDGRAGTVEWRHERDVTPETADAWLARFRADEPTAEFVVHDGAPKRKTWGLKKKR